MKLFKLQVDLPTELEPLMEELVFMRATKLASIIHVRAKTSVEEDKSGKSSLIMKFYMVNKAKMLKKIARLVKEEN